MFTIPSQSRLHDSIFARLLLFIVLYCSEILYLVPGLPTKTLLPPKAALPSVDATEPSILASLLVALSLVQDPAASPVAPSSSSVEPSMAYYDHPWRRTRESGSESGSTGEKNGSSEESSGSESEDEHDNGSTSPQRSGRQVSAAEKGSFARR